MIDVVVPGRVVGKQRPRVSKKHGTYTPAETRDYEQRIAWVIKGRHPGLQVDSDGEWTVVVTVVVGDRRRRDLDNIIKAVMDAMIGVVYVDDAQVVSMKATKRYSKSQWFTMVTAWRE